MINAILSDIYNEDTLNIFCDASTIETDKPNHKYSGCYGVAALREDNIIEEEYKLVSNTTSNEAEIKGMRGAISFANKYKSNFKYINIFSDSQTSVVGLRRYIYYWYCSDNILYTRSYHTPAANQSIFIECHEMLYELGQYPYCVVRVYQQKGHIRDTENDIIKAAQSFAKNNPIDYPIYYDFIRYISKYNNMVDNRSRNKLRKNISLLQTKDFSDPIEFYAKEAIRDYTKI